jgi:trigger factor
MEVMPTIAMPDFAAITLTRIKTEVGSDLIEAALTRIAKANRTLQPLTAEDLAARPEGDGAVTGDVLTVDFLGKIDDVPFDGGAGTDVEVEIGGDSFIPGFAEQLVGAKPDEARTIAVTFPQTYGKAEMAGKAATFDVTVKQISRQSVPPIDDALAISLGLETEAELRELVRSRQQQEYDQVSRVRLKKALMDSLANLADFPVPPSLVDDEFKQIWEQFEKARAEGRQDKEDKEKDDDTLRADYRTVAERRVRLGLLLSEIGSVNAITVTEQELDRAIAARVRQYSGQERQMFELYRKYPELSNSIRAPLLEDKVVDFILELATVTDQVVPLEALLKEDDAEDVPTAATPDAPALE